MLGTSALLQIDMDVEGPLVILYIWEFPKMRGRQIGPQGTPKSFQKTIPQRKKQYLPSKQHPTEQNSVRTGKATRVMLRACAERVRMSWNGFRTDSERIPNGFRTDSERVSNGFRRAPHTTWPRRGISTTALRLPVFMSDSNFLQRLQLFEPKLGS